MSLPPQLSHLPMFQANPFMAHWLGAAERATALMLEMNQQALRFWTGWMPRREVPVAAQPTPPLPQEAAAPALPTPALEPMAEPVPLAAAPAPEPAVPPGLEPVVQLPAAADPAEIVRKKPGKGAVQLRTVVARRKGAVEPAKKPVGRRITRH